jgi:hypothetical protein
MLINYTDKVEVKLHKSQRCALEKCKVLASRLNLRFVLRGNCVKNHVGVQMSY